MSNLKQPLMVNYRWRLWLVLLIIAFVPLMPLTNVFALRQSAAESGETRQTVQKPGLGSNRGPRLGDAVDFRYQVVGRMAAIKGSVQNVVMTFPVPQEWPEQQVSVIEESVPPAVTVWAPRQTNRAPMQMVGTLPVLKKGEIALFSLKYNVTVSSVLPPEDPSLYSIPRKLDREMKGWLKDSPGIEANKPLIRKVMRELEPQLNEKGTDWERVNTLRQWILDNVEMTSEGNLDTEPTLKGRKGNNEDCHRLFVAMCRASKIPARMVWCAEKADYAEFYLIDDEDEGFWFPCLVTPAFELGANPRPVVIQQRGDHFEVPEKKGLQLNYVNGFGYAQGRSEPLVEFVDGLITEDRDLLDGQ